MLLIGTYLSPFARRVAAALVSRDIRFEHDDLNGYADPVRALSLNPVGKVPILRLDSGECLIDSAAILDHLNEGLPPPLSLLPAAGAERREVLRLAAIATTIYERSTVCYFEALQRPDRRRQDIIDAQEPPIVGGLRALDAASAPGGAIGSRPFSIATLSAVIAREYLAIAMPELRLGALAPALASVSTMLADDRAFAATRPFVAGDA